MRIATIRPDGTAARYLTSDHADSSPAWSPDGRTIAFIRRDEQKKSPGAPAPNTRYQLVLGTPPLRLHQRRARQRQIYVRRLRPAPTAEPDRPANYNSALARWPGWSPDGRSQPVSRPPFVRGLHCRALAPTERASFPLTGQP
jgi:Tol biopolymer transport system component